MELSKWSSAANVAYSTTFYLRTTQNLLLYYITPGTDNTVSRPPHERDCLPYLTIPTGTVGDLCEPARVTGPAVDLQIMALR